MLPVIMSRLTAVFFTTVVACVSAQLVSVDISQLGDGEQKATGQADFNYFSNEAEHAAVLFLSYIHKYDCAINGIVDELKSKYTIHGELVDECAATIPLNLSADLNRTVTESLVQVQTLDNKLRTNSILCFSLRVPQPESCVKAKDETLQSLASVSSEEELERINQEMREAVASAEAYLKACIQVNINNES